MFRLSRLLLSLAVLGALVAQASAQVTNSGQTVQAPSQTSAADSQPPDLLPGLPRLPDQPRSLYQQPPVPFHTCEVPECPYFRPDPLLDPPCLLPGWFANAEVGIVAPAVKDRPLGMVVANGMLDTVQLPIADLDYTIAPRLEFGYRLPSGFGAFALAYRFMVSEGVGTTVGNDAPAYLKSRLDLNQLDVDYLSSEFSLLPCCEMRWRVGIRLVHVYFDSHVVEPFDPAAAGSGVFEQRMSNLFRGIGPHAGLELGYQIKGTGLSVIGKLDATTILGRLQQDFFERSTILDPTTGNLLSGETHNYVSQDVPMVNVQMGLGWNPSPSACVRLFLGYEYETWWNVGRNSSVPNSRGDLIDHGVVLRGEINF
jgi:hypothetical protein